MSSYGFTVYEWAKLLVYLNELLDIKWKDFEELKKLSQSKEDFLEYCEFWNERTDFLRLLRDIGGEEPSVFLEDNPDDKLNKLACQVCRQILSLSVVDDFGTTSKSLYEAFHPEKWTYEPDRTQKQIETTLSTKEISTIREAFSKLGFKPSPPVEYNKFQGHLDFLKKIRNPDNWKNDRLILKTIVQMIKNANGGANVICIDLKRFNKKTGSKALLVDLIADMDREGVTLDEKKYGKKQPQSLRDILNNNGYKEVAQKVKLKKNKVALHIPFEQITTDSQKTEKK